MCYLPYGTILYCTSTVSTQALPNCFSMYAHSQFSLSFSTFSVSFSCWRKHNHSRSEESCIHPWSNLPGITVFDLNRDQTTNNHMTTYYSFLVLSFTRWASTIMLERSVEIFRSWLKPNHWVRAQWCGNTPHNHKWKYGCRLWFTCPVITVFRCVTFSLLW